MTPFRASAAVLFAFLAVESAAQLATSIATTATSVTPGATLVFTGEVRNTHNAALSFGYTLSVDEGRIVSTDDPSCHYVVPYLMQCSATLLAGAVLPFRVTAEATNDAARVGQLLTGRVTAQTVIPDDQPVFSSAQAQVPIVSGVAEDFARVLVPVLANETPGARATWTSHLSAVTLAHEAIVFLCSSQCEGTRLRAGVPERLWPGPQPGAAAQGALLYIERDAEPQTTFSARLSSSRSSEARGVELPIVRESEFRTERLILPSIRLDAEHRFLLRVYDPDALPQSGVTVRLFETTISHVLAEVTLPLTAPPDRVVATLPAFPGYAQTSAIFDTVLPASGSRDVGLEIVGLRPGQKIWAFVSATENAGEHVTLITPQ